MLRVNLAVGSFRDSGARIEGLVDKAIAPAPLTISDHGDRSPRKVEAMG